jgi:hypothetical protein
MLMRHQLRALAVLLLLAGSVAAGEPKWSLPTNPQAAVVELKSRAPAGTAPDTTVIRIRGTGEFEVGASGEQGYVAGQMTSGELLALLRDLIEREHALELTTGALAAGVTGQARKSGKEVGFQNAPDMVVRIALASGTHEFRCRSPEALRTRFPGMQDLDRVCAIIRRLENVAAVAQIGGRREAERVAALATAELRRQNGPDVAVTVGDLLQVRGNAGDLRQSQFVVEPALRGEAGTGVHVSVMESPGETPRISMTRLSPALR